MATDRPMYGSRLAALLALLACGACQLDLGPTPDAAACAPSPDYYASDVYPRYLVANACGTGECHAFQGGQGSLRLRPPAEAAPAPGTPLPSWPFDWREDYLSSIQLLRCDEPLESRLLTVPEGAGNLHPPGPVVLDRRAAATVIQTWIATP